MITEHPSGLRLRPARPSDEDFLFAVRRSSFRTYVDELSGWDDGEQRELAAREFGALPVQIVMRAGRPVGYLCVVCRDEFDDLDEIALLPEARGRRIGTTLVRHVMSEASHRGVPLRLSVFVDNPARRLYERLGFREIRIEPPRITMEWSNPIRVEP
jgi:ribosomal protein S18 acetylase RimI-like enzyme